jgi:hypothetical protein
LRFTIFAVPWRLPKFLVSILEFTSGKNFGSLKSANIVAVIASFTTGDFTPIGVLPEMRVFQK